jgi:D-lactate dehydrogenase
MDVFFYEAFEEESAALRHHLQPHIRAGYSWKTIQECGHEQPPAPIISTRTQSVVPTAWATTLRAILSRSTGYEHLLAYRQHARTDLACGHLPRYCHRAVAEQTLLLWMALLRKLVQQRDNFARFHRDGLTGAEAEGKTLVVVGVGNIGTEVCRLGMGLGMRVIGVDIVHKNADINYQPRDQALPEADVIVASMNLTPRNKGYFGYEVLRQAKRGVVFVNVSRGEFSPPSVLLRLLQEGHLGGVALDVYDHEPELAHALRSGKPGREPEVEAALALQSWTNVILTPHNAFNTQEAVERKAAHSAQQLHHFVSKGRFLWSIPDE